MRSAKALLAALLASVAMDATAQEDPHLWLEEVGGEKPLAWARERNAESRAKLEAHPEFKALHERLLGIYQSRERIPSVSVRKGRVYNLWQDETHPRGIWRRAALDDFRKGTPAWETVLDLDKLSKETGERWVFKSAECLFPDYRRCLVSLSRGGADATVIREFDLVEKDFVKGGFELPESKGGAEWRDADTLYIYRDFGAGSMTRSGYPHVIKEWKRGTPLAQARTIFEGSIEDVGGWITVYDEMNGREARQYAIARRGIEYYRGEWHLRQGERWLKLDVPVDSKVAIAHGRLMVELRGDWQPGKGPAFKAGSLVAIPVEQFVAGRRDFVAVFEPTERAFLKDWIATRRHIVLNVMDNVKTKVLQGHRHYGVLRFREVPLPPAATGTIAAVEQNDSDDYWVTTTSFIQPTTLNYFDTRKNELEKVKSLPAFFDAKGLAVAQYEATSKDGTKVPYFVVSREGLELDGSNPTILYGYGGFAVSQLPNYSGAIGAAWLEKGGVWVLSNLRGGGEFGPRWHLAAQREGRQKTHDDYIAVAEDLARRGITSPRKLGIYGGSQGGLLVGAVMAQRPDLFKAVVATVPLFDMKRYHKLPAGASWMAEYGNPDVEGDWAFISKYSPYQLVRKDAKYPKLFVATSTRDDRVQPGHARKMVARMKEYGHDVLYYENTEGGHGLGSTPAQNAYAVALIYTFFASELR